MHREVLLSSFILALCAIGMHAQARNEEPFLLQTGEKYRDRLTIMASKAVAEYADAYTRRQQREIQRNKALNRGPAQSPKFYSLRLDTPTGSPASNKALYFTKSRSITLDENHKKDRKSADKDEELLVQGKKPEKETVRSSSPVSALPSRASKLPSSLFHRPAGRLYQTATSYGNRATGPSSSYALVRSPGTSYSVDTDHNVAAQIRQPSPSHYHTPAYSYTINTGAYY